MEVLVSTASGVNAGGNDFGNTQNPEAGNEKYCCVEVDEVFSAMCSILTRTPIRLPR